MIRLRGLAGDTVVYGLSSAARSLVGLLLVPIYTRVFQVGDYGRIDTLTTLVAALTLLLTLGMDSAAAMYYYDNEGERDRGRMLATAVASRIVLPALAALLLSLAAPSLSRLLFETEGYAGTVRMAVWTAPATALVGFLIEIARLARRPWLYSALSVANLLSGLAFSIVFVVVLRWGTAGVFAGPLAGNAVVLPVALWQTRRFLTRSFSFSWLRRLTHVGLPLALSGLGGWVIAYANRYVLLYLGSAAAVGLLAVGNKVSAPLVLLTTAFRIAWVPFAFSIQKQATAPAAYAKALTYFCLISGTLGMVTSLFAREALVVFTTEQYVAGYVVTGLMSLQIIADACYYITNIGLMLAKRTRALAGSMLVAAAVSVVLDFLLVPPFGVFGAALANAITYVGQAVAVGLLAQRAYPIPFETGKLFRLGVLWVSAWALGLLASRGAIWPGVALKGGILAGFLIGIIGLRVVDGGEAWQAARSALAQARGLTARRSAGAAPGSPGRGDG